MPVESTQRPRVKPSAPGCRPKSERERGESISLPVLSGHVARNAWQSGHEKIKHSRVGTWRAIVLILVNLIMAAHFVQWLITGWTLSPIEPSESMHTLRDGAANAGFVFFVLAIVSTMLFGRWFCGWGCHIVSLQDLCAWVMMKVRVKPKPFRSRLLLFVPLGLAIYMFVWPVVHREVVRPLFMDARGRLPQWLGQANPLAGIRSEFIVEEYWATFPPWYVAIPFLAVCGFACVYLLGAKGFCTYGCPYGGFFAPADLVAVGKIRVNEDCNQCGHCTAVCTSNVRVHEEVRDFGMVVDPGCMKCMDCVSVCPNDALRFGLGAPTVLARPIDDDAKARAAKARALRSARFDLTIVEEVVLAAVWLAMFQSFRGMLNMVPMLMAVGLAGCGTFLVWKTWRLVRDANVRVQGLQLKFKGKVRAPGVCVGVLSAVVVFSAGWSGWVRWNLYRAEAGYETLITPIGNVLASGFAPSPSEVRRASESLKRFDHAGPISQGGWGWRHTPDELTQIAYMRVLIGDLKRAEAALDEVIERGRPQDGLIFQMARIMSARGATAEEVGAMYTRALGKHPALQGVRGVIAKGTADKGDRLGGIKLWDDVLADERVKSKPAVQLGAAQGLLQLGERARANALAYQAADSHEATPEIMLAAARLLSEDEATRAVEIANRAAAKSDATSLGATRIAAADFIAQLGRTEEAYPMATMAVRRAKKAGPHIGQSDTLFSSGLLMVRLERAEEGLKLIREAATLVATSPWDAVPIVKFFIQFGRQSGQPGVVEEGWRLMDEAARFAPDHPMIQLELAQASYAAGKFDQALAAMKTAAEIGSSSPLLADRYSQLLGDRGQGTEAAKWKEEAKRRAAVLQAKK